MPRLPQYVTKKDLLLFKKEIKAMLIKMKGKEKKEEKKDKMKEKKKGKGC